MLGIKDYLPKLSTNFVEYDIDASLEPWRNP
jgi:hypothetical protein